MNRRTSYRAPYRPAPTQLHAAVDTFRVQWLLPLVEMLAILVMVAAVVMLS